MNNFYYKILSFILFSLILSQNQNPYLDIANELMVRIKLSDKLPDVFTNSKFIEISSKLDKLENVNFKNHNNRLTINSPEFHWCYANTYMLAGNLLKSLDHYRQYKIQTLGSSKNIHPLFQKTNKELEIELENQQSNLAYDIKTNIENFKTDEKNPNQSQIREIQSKLNAYNELILSSKIISLDGVLGPETKSAIYDFEKDNPYFLDSGSIENSSNFAIEISSLPSSIRPVSTTPDIFESSVPNANSNKSLNNSIKLSTKIILDSEKIKTMPGNSIAEKLEHVLGLNIKRSGISDAHANISTLAGTSEQTLILVDGLKISNQQSLHHDLDLPINIDDIKQIEILRNPAARKYGSGAISGIINIITKKGNQRNSYISTELGDYSLLNGNLAINIPIGKSFHNISFTDIYSNGFQPNTDFIKRTFYYKYALQDGKSYTNFSFGHLSRGNGLTNHLSNINQYQNQYENNITKFFNTKILWDFKDIKLESNMHWFDHQDEVAQDRDKGGWSHYAATEIGVNFNSTINWNWGISQPSFTYNKETNSNTTLKDIKRDHYTLSYQHEFSINNIILNLGLSSNYYNDFGWFFAPGYQFIYNLNNNANIYHQFDHGFRLPSFFEMYANDHMYNGNKDLKGETIFSNEYGIQLYGSALRMTLSQFHKNNKDVIDWYAITSGNKNTWKSINVPDVITSGHNIHIELYPEIIKFLTFLKRFDMGYGYLELEHNGQKDEYKNLSYYFKHQMTMGFQYNLPFGISRSWYLRYEQPSKNDNRTIIDTQIHFKLWRFENTLNISNIFDVQYTDIKYVSLPGRWIKFSIRYNI